MDTLRWNEEDQVLELIDQTKLPLEAGYLKCASYLEIAEAINNMSVRGAPAIGVSAAFGLALAAKEFHYDNSEDFFNKLDGARNILAGTRPTAVNLFWALERMGNTIKRLKQHAPKTNLQVFQALLAEAKAIQLEDLAMNKKMGRLALELIPDKARILTHCNAGGLATAGYGTALGIIRAAWEAGKEVAVWVDETRPLLQGARLTAWELAADGIPATLICDNMAGYLMQKGQVDLVVVGADRIAANGDVANKIGTYSVAILAKEHNIPFYVAAPTSTLDMKIPNGDDIPIEERDSDEVRFVFGKQIAPKDIPVFNPSFDITPNRLITAIITDQGIIRPPYHENLTNIFGKV
ncbi:MAG: S-methyl-5-thioribose-1-phosphate isomerase [Clostridia bacterium]|jgi:methylthioribose-1-phosphate isomerase|nr:S-methyl-5-thioribose-1-phosphate isomerase [Clostridia bacterium]